MSSPPFTEFHWTTTNAPVPGITTSRTELASIAIAYTVLTLDLIFILGATAFLFGGNPSRFLASLSGTLLLVAAVAAFTGFVAHELAHKVVAQRLGYWAEFRMSPMGLLFSLFTAATFGFLLAAPGATVVGGMNRSDARGWGRTSLAGPLTNGTFAIAFYLSAIGTFPFSPPAAIWLLFLAYINALFGAFNLLPIGPLDGAKVLRWQTSVWVVAFVSLAALTGVSYFAWTLGTPFLHLR